MISLFLGSGRMIANKPLSRPEPEQPKPKPLKEYETLNGQLDLALSAAKDEEQRSESYREYIIRLDELMQKEHTL